jgi:Ala-tRNA(Pro) deacylase
MDQVTKIESLLKNSKIEFDKYEFETFPPPDSFWTEHNLIRCKNLFLRDNHGKNHYLVIIDYYKTLDIKKLQEIVGRGSLTFASERRLEKYLRLKPGYISVFGILNDVEKHVKVIIDKELNQSQNLSFIPNKPGYLFSLSFKGLIIFIEKSENKFQVHRLK